MTVLRSETSHFISRAHTSAPIEARRWIRHSDTVAALSIMNYEHNNKKTQRTGESSSQPTRPSHLKRTSSATKGSSGASTDAEERHYYLYVPSLQEYKKTRWTEAGIENLKRDLAVAQETISEFKDLIADLETPKPREELKKYDRAEKKTETYATTKKRLNRKEREKREKIEKLKKEQEEMLKDLDDIFDGGV